jgi:hypothetical protein
MDKSEISAALNCMITGIEARVFICVSTGGGAQEYRGIPDFPKQDEGYMRRAKVFAALLREIAEEIDPVEGAPK